MSKNSSEKEEADGVGAPTASEAPTTEDNFNEGDNNSAAADDQGKFAESGDGDEVDIQVTKFRTDKGILTKVITLGPDGGYVSDGSACRMTSGTAFRVWLRGFTGLADFIDNLQSNEALALGPMPSDFGDSVRIVGQKQLDEFNFVNTISRTQRFFKAEKGVAAAFMLDHDMKGMPPEVAARLKELAKTLPKKDQERLGEMAGFVAAIRSLIEGFDGLGYVLRGSTSGGLYIPATDTEPAREFSAKANCHLYLIIRDGADAFRAIRALQDRAWLAGLGWHWISKGGHILKRSIVDITVASAERLIFEGLPIVEKPLAKHPRKSEVRQGRLFDTLLICDLDASENVRLAQLLQKSATGLGKELKAIQKRVFEARVKEGVDRGEDETRVRKSLSRMFDGEQVTLYPQLLLRFDELGEVTVSDALADPQKFRDAKLADPIEPNGDGDFLLQNKAVFFLGDDHGDPLIFSNLHGGQLYRLRWDFENIHARIAAVDKKNLSERAAVVPTLVQMLTLGGADSPVTDAEESILIDEAAKKSGVGKRVIASELKDARERRAPDPADNPPDDLDADDRGQWPADRPGWPDLNKAMEPTGTLENTKLAVRRMGLALTRDEFRGADLISGELNGTHYYDEEVDDRIIRLVRERIRIWFEFDPGKENVDEALLTLADHRQFHPIRDWLAGLKWDGIQRLDGLFVDYFGVADTKLHRAFARKTMIAAVRRVRRPGVKFDTMVIFEGNQGSGKTTALKILAGEDFHRSGPALSYENTAKFVEDVRGAWFYESGELISFKRAEVEHLKEVMSRTVDRCRPAYARRVIDVARQNIFWGSTNADNYLRDASGNRRFWPVLTGKINLEALLRDRDQIWAEAAHYERQGEALELPEELWGVAAVAQASRMEVDPWADLLRDIVQTQSGWPEQERRVKQVGAFYRIPAPIVREDILGLNDAKMADSRRLADVMRVLGWHGPAPLSLGDGRAAVRCYEKAVVLVRAEELENLLHEMEANKFDVPEEWTDAAAKARETGVALGKAAGALRQAVEARAAERRRGADATEKAAKEADAAVTKARSDLDAFGAAAVCAMVSADEAFRAAETAAWREGIRFDAFSRKAGASQDVDLDGHAGMESGDAAD